MSAIYLRITFPMIIFWIKGQTIYLDLSQRLWAWLLPLRAAMHSVSNRSISAHPRSSVLRNADQSCSPE